MKLKIFVGAVCALIILTEALADGEVEEYNLPPQTRSGKDTYLAEIIAAPIENARNEKHPDMEEDQSRIEENNEDESDDDEDMSQNLIAVGPNFGNMAGLVPANLSVIQAAGVGSRQIIGYIPISSPNGAALVFPAGGVRVVNPEDSVTLDEEAEIERAVRRQNAARRNNVRRGNRRRSGYAVYRPIPNYWRRRRPSTASYGRRRNGNGNRNKKKRFRSQNGGYRSLEI